MLVREKFRDANKDCIGEGVYRKKRDRHTLYFFQNVDERLVEQDRRVPVWIAKKVSVEPPVFEDVLVSSEESSNYRPVSVPERYIQQMLFSACSKLQDLRRKSSELSDIF